MFFCVLSFMEGRKSRLMIRSGISLVMLGMLRKENVLIEEKLFRRDLNLSASRVSWGILTNSDECSNIIIRIVSFDKFVCRIKSRAR